MARATIGNPHGFAARSDGSGVEPTNFNGSSDGDITSSYKDADILDVGACRARLAAIDGTTYTDAYMDVMLLNDMRYAIRLNDDAGTI